MVDETVDIGDTEGLTAALAKGQESVKKAIGSAGETWDARQDTASAAMEKIIKAWDEIKWPAKIEEGDRESLKSLLLGLVSEGEEKGKSPFKKMADKAGAKTAAALAEARRTLYGFINEKEKPPTLGGQAATASEILGAVPVVGSLVGESTRGVVSAVRGAGKVAEKILPNPADIPFGKVGKA